MSCTYLAHHELESVLIIIIIIRQQPTYALAATTAAKQPELWHRRFGHLGCDNLFKLKNKHMVEGISVPAEAFKEQQQQKPFCEKPNSTGSHFQTQAAAAQAY